MNPNARFRDGANEVGEEQEKSTIGETFPFCVEMLIINFIC